ncbi:hypothetical protein LTS10_003205 [Elasticomyces elasticus]|nr:hypothetical protein LTS10_003205 [Elasticomyces elasticus]
MRLLNLHSLQFEEFYGEYDTPPYAILSHRWTKHEVSYHDFVNGCNESSDGYRKILDFCAFARSRATRVWNQERQSFEHVALQWGWLDTICIDKTSSQEVSESINSMFAWYEKAAVCYAFLGDVPALDEGFDVVAEAFVGSEWFERGWTLQELLAPPDVIFCNQAWQVLGHKCTHVEEKCPVVLYELAHQSLHFHKEPQLACTGEDHKYIYGPSLNAEISERSRIDPCYLEEKPHAFQASVACRLSWAARRRTTRVEDRAYCMLGILQVNMPLLYGEGSGAFGRLQEELIRRSSDQSIFGWKYNGLRPNKSSTALAFDPSQFAESSNIIATGQPPDAPYALTNIGLEIRARTRKVWDSGLNNYVFVIKLNCGHYRAEDGERTSGSTKNGREKDFVPAVMAITSMGSSSPVSYERVHCSPETFEKKGEEVAERLFYIRPSAFGGAGRRFRKEFQAT